MQQRIDEGLLVLSGNGDEEGGTWTVNYWTPKVERKKYKTVWWSKQHDAGTHGTTLLPKFLGRRNAFPFPKSLYAVRDTLLSVVRDRPDALILDFFAGSGTTLHATALINEADGGNRRCLMVTNNEVDIKTARQLVNDGHLPGDREFEQHGIFWQATRPRCEAALTGKTPDGDPVPGVYADSRRPHAEGFEENVEFFELHYLDKDAVRQGSQFSAIEPSLWLAAGGVGTRPSSDDSKRFTIPKGSNYGVLFDRAAFADFRRALAKRPEVTHVFLVTDSEASYSQMCGRLDESITKSMLYRDYITNFRINTLEAYR
jgi:adenine-specific DNA-methyltransferase